jgi:hypothetical protein
MPTTSRSASVPVFLQLQHLEEAAGLVDQFLVGAHLRDPALVEDDDPVGEAGVLWGFPAVV